MKIIREGKEYDVVEYCSETGSACVEIEMDFYYEPHKRKVKCWWTSDTYEVKKD
jgi:hypothetical protein